MEDAAQRRVILGRIAGLQGLCGWLKVISYTEPRAHILDFAVWDVLVGGDWRAIDVAAGRMQGTRVVAQLEGVRDRVAAAAFVGADIAVARSALPPAGEGEYYWSDLEGLCVRNLEGRELGFVSHLFATGANDVMVVRGERERLLPFTPGAVVREVDLERRELRVDWDPEF